MDMLVSIKKYYFRTQQDGSAGKGLCYISQATWVWYKEST